MKDEIKKMYNEERENFEDYCKRMEKEIKELRFDIEEKILAAGCEESEKLKEFFDNIIREIREMKI